MLGVARKQSQLGKRVWKARERRSEQKSGGGLGLTGDYRGEQTRLKPLEAKSRERDSLEC